MWRPRKRVAIGLTSSGNCCVTGRLKMWPMVVRKPRTSAPMSSNTLAIAHSVRGSKVEGRGSKVVVTGDVGHLARVLPRRTFDLRPSTQSADQDDADRRECD